MNKEILTAGLREGAIKVCDKIKQMFLDGECDHLTANDLETWMKLSEPSEFFTGEQAVNHTGLGNTKFYAYRKAGLIHQPEKLRGYAKPLYSKLVLDEDLKYISSLNEREIRRRILSPKGVKK